MAKDVQVTVHTTTTTTTTNKRFISTLTGRCFIGFVILFEVLLVAATIMMGVWMGVYRDGYDWNGTPIQQFSYHPLLMTIGLIFLYGNGMLMFRLFRGCRKLALKIVHGIVQISSLVFAAVGLAAVFDHHNRSGIPNMYSLHSWLGLISVILFGLQWLVALLMFLLPLAKHNLRKFLQPIHVYVGVMLFVMVVAVALIGMTQLLFSKNIDYPDFPPEGVFANCLALILGLIIFIGVFLVADFDFRRNPLPNETD